MRWLVDEIDDNEDRPYREGNMYLCRNCGVQMSRRRALCRWCWNDKRRRMSEEKYADDHTDD